MEQEEGDLSSIVSVGRTTDSSATNNWWSFPVDASPKIWTEAPFLSHFLPSIPSQSSVLQRSAASVVLPNFMFSSMSSFGSQDVCQTIHGSNQSVHHSPPAIFDTVHSGFASCCFAGLPESAPSLHAPPNQNAQGERTNQHQHLLDMGFEGHKTPSAILTKFYKGTNQEKAFTTGIEDTVTMSPPSISSILSTSTISESGFDGRSKCFRSNYKTGHSEALHVTLKGTDNLSSPPKRDTVGETTVPTRHKESKNHIPKRRKAQQKRTVYVPAANGIGKSTGECVASDSWTWRKYGQKPIKGSPYPRGYYRCSSSKGCSARKQVERSLTDPSMLVITYTSDHNHPCPTQRNAVGAGSNHQNSSERDSTQSSDSAVFPCEVSGSNSEPSDNPLSSVLVTCPDLVEEQLISSAPCADMEEAFNLPQDIGTHFLRSHTKDEDFFAELGELPDTFPMFGRQSIDDRSDDDGGTGIIDPYNLFNWSSSLYDGICLIR